MNKKNLILSVVTIIALITFSVSFAYFLMEITGTGTNQTEVTTGKLILNIDDNSINVENLPPVDDLDYKEYAYNKEFNIVNNGTLNGCSDIYLNITNISEELKSPYLKYAVVTSTDIYTGSFDELENNRIKIATSSFVEAKTTKLHTLYIWVSYDKADVNQASMLNKSLTATLSIESKDCKNVAHTLLSKMLSADTPQSDASIDFTKDKDGCYYDGESDTIICPEGCSEDPDTSEITCEEGKGDTNGKGLYYASDTSKTENNKVVYYYRGDVTNNYVVFAGYCFRIVRTNEDGSIKLVNRGTATESDGAYTCPTYENITVPITSAFNANYNDNAYVGYMYGTAGSSTYELTHANINDSTVKTAIDTWYENAFNENERALIVDTIYCNDRSLSEEFTFLGNTAKNTEISGYGQNETYYSATKRLFTGTPQYKCPQVNDKFTVSSTKGNGALKYPIALLTADEAMYAGSTYGTESKNYLYNTNHEWLMTAIAFRDGGAYELYLDSGHVGIYHRVYNGYAVFPAVSLSSNTQIISGDGTINNPYVIKE